MPTRSSIIAITHVPSPAMQACELTFVQPRPIDIKLAARQHEEYCGALRELGGQVITLTQSRALPDCTFIEDTAIVLDEVAVLGSMGAASRRAEPLAISNELEKYRPVRSIEPPGTLEGGDVLRIGRTLLVGQSSRTNAQGIAALAAALEPLNYRVIRVSVRNCLHLKTACTALPDGSLLVHRAWFDHAVLADFEMIDVPEREPFAANVALIGQAIMISASHPQTAALLRSRGFLVRPVEIGEFEKAEGGVTCLSILFEKRSLRNST